MWNTGKLHSNTLYYPRHFGLDFFFFSHRGYCCNGLWPRRNTREKGKLHAQLAEITFKRQYEATPSLPHHSRARTTKWWRGEGSLCTGETRGLSPTCNRLCRQSTKRLSLGKFQNEQEIWTDFSCTFEIPSGIQCNNTRQTGLLRRSRPLVRQTVCLFSLLWVLLDKNTKQLTCTKRFSVH